MRTDFRLALPAATAWITLAVAIGAPDVLPALAAVGWVSTGILLGAAILLRERVRVLVFAVLVLSAVSLVLTSAAIASPERRPAELVEAAASGRFVTGTATVTETVLPGDGSFTVTLESVTIGEWEADVRVPARVFGRAAEEPLGIGAGIGVSGRLASTEPGDALAFMLFTTEPPLLHSDEPWFLAWADGLRSGFRATSSALPGNGGDLLPGLAIGDTTAVSASLDGAMKAVSLSHLTAVSGANCAVVIGLIMAAGASLGLTRGARIVASVLVLAGFVVLVTPEPSVLRAAVMATIALVALSGGRPARGVPVVALAVLVLLCLDPWLAREYGFVLSVLATTGLLVLAGPLTSVLARHLPRLVAVWIAIPLSAQLACQPVLILLTPSIPTYGVLANVLAGPAAPVATILGLLSCVLSPPVPVVGTAIAHLAWAPAAWIAAVATYCSELPGAAIPWVEGAVGVVLVIAMTALGLVAILRRRRDRWSRAAALAFAIVLVAYGGALAGSSFRTSLTRPTAWQHAICDVGQGDAVLVRSGGVIALIDTGPDPAALTACLDGLGISRIDLLVLTHFDLDHVAGTPAVIGLADTAIVGPPDGPEADRLIADLRDGGTIVQQASAGLAGRLGGLSWSVLWPPARSRAVVPGNDASIVLRFDDAGHCPDRCLSSLFLGDLGEEAQTRLLASAPIAPVDVVKVAHHGSADQSARLYERIDAEVGMIGVGVDNRYGHPTDRLLALLGRAGTTVARTDRNGLVLVAPGADGAIEIWSERDG